MPLIGGPLIANGDSGPLLTEDLITDTSKKITNTDYYDVVIQGLKVNKEYVSQFRWQYEDGTFGEWSNSYEFTTDDELDPDTPSTPILVTGVGFFTVRWNGNNSTGQALTDFSQINVYVSGGSFNASLPAATLTQAGTANIAAAIGSYSVTFKALRSSGKISDSSTAASVSITTDSTDAAAAQSDAEQALLELQNKLTKTANMLIVNDNLTAINSNGISLFATGTENASASSVPTSGRRIVMNYKGIRAYNSSSSDDESGVTFAISAEFGNAYFSGEISSSTITASTIRTAESSTLRRAVFDPSTHALSFYASGGAGQAHISPLNDTNNPGVIISSGSSALSSILLSSDPSFLMYKSNNTTGQITLYPGSGGFLSISPTLAQWAGTTPVLEFGTSGGAFRNIETVTTTNWGDGSAYSSVGTVGEVMLVYTP